MALGLDYTGVGGAEAEDTILQHYSRTLEVPAGRIIESIEHELLVGDGGEDKWEQERNGKGQALGEHHWTLESSSRVLQRTLQIC